jgi:hypothetical protein
MSDETPENENPDVGWPKHDRTEAPEIGLFVSDVELYRRLGVGPKTGRIAVLALEPHGFLSSSLFSARNAIGRQSGFSSIGIME